MTVALPLFGNLVVLPIFYDIELFTLDTVFSPSIVKRVVTMAMSIVEVRKLKEIEKVIVHSLDLCLYQVSVLVDGIEHIVTDKKGKLLRSFNTLEIQAMFETLPVKETVLRHQSAYDEMVGLSYEGGTNAMEVPLGNNKLGDVPKNLQ